MLGRPRAVGRTAKATARWKRRPEFDADTNPAAWLSGYIPDLPTPFDDGGGIDLAAFAMLCERQIKAGVSALVVCETAGEASTLTSEEQDSSSVRPSSRRRPHPVIAGAGSNSTSQAIELTQRAGSSRRGCGAFPGALLQQADAGGHS